MQALYDEKGASLRIQFLKEEPAQDFIKTHSGILNDAMKSADMSKLMRSRLEQSNYIFSGMKTFHELNEAFPSVTDSNGDKKPFNQFMNDVQSIDESYNKNYLQSEYNFVGASADMAGRWENFSKDEDDYNLQYRTAGDSHVRPEHAELNGVTLPFSDPFWDEYYPPNGWNCRCTVVQVLKDKYPATPHEEATDRGRQALSGDKSGMFRFNSGKQQRSVPAYNPYTIQKCKTCTLGARKKSNLAKSDIPSADICAACKLLQDMTKKNN